jgi:hypothetical protein
MKYDYSFFASFSLKRRKLFGAGSIVEGALTDFFASAKMADSEVTLIQQTTGDLFFAKGAYFKGGQSVRSLEASLKTKLPEDFVQFYEQFGESAIITRSEPILIYPLQQMIDDFEDDPDIEIEQGRFFRFARYQDPLYLGLRKDDQTDEWQVVISTYGLLYSEMIGPQGRGNVVAPSFYAWLKHLVETDGYPDLIYPHGGNMDYLTVLEE